LLVIAIAAEPAARNCLSEGKLAIPLAGKPGGTKKGKK